MGAVAGFAPIRPFGPPSPASGGREMAAPAVPECDLPGKHHALAARARSASARSRVVHSGIAGASGKERPAGTGGRRALARARTARAFPLLARPHAGPDAGRNRRTWWQRRHGLLRRPDPGPLVGAPAGDHGLRPRRGTAD